MTWSPGELRGKMRQYAALAHRLRNRKPCVSCGVLCEVCRWNQCCCLGRR